MIKFVELTQDQYAIVDVDKFDDINKLKWYAHRSAAGYYAGTNVRIKPGRTGAFKTMKMHRFVVGAADGEVVDHKNHDTLDNRVENLRRCTSRDNARNSNKRKENKSGFKGVSWHKAADGWVAQISITESGVRRGIHLGVFEDRLAAARAYDVAAREHYGEFALLNFPEET